VKKEDTSCSCAGFRGSNDRGKKGIHGTLTRDKKKVKQKARRERTHLGKYEGWLSIKKRRP